MGNPDSPAPPATESRFVADEGLEFDVPHPIVSSGQVESVLLKTTRVVGTVGPDGFFEFDPNDPTTLPVHLTQGTLAPTLVLTIMARIRANPDVGGVLGLDGLDVEVDLHTGLVGHDEVRLGSLEGFFGAALPRGDDGERDWQRFTLDVPVLGVRWPADPCLGQDSTLACSLKPEPRPNGIFFEFTGTIDPRMGLTFEIDWVSLEPKDQLGLAWRPVLLAPGWGLEDFGFDAWSPGLRARDIGFRVGGLSPFGTIRHNGHEVEAAVADLKDRFGVERVNVVGYCKGGLDARQHVRGHDDVDTLIMLATPNEGSFFVNNMTLEARRSLLTEAEARPHSLQEVAQSLGELTSSRLRRYNRHCPQNPATDYVAAAFHSNLPAATQIMPGPGPSDGWVHRTSVWALPYAIQEPYSFSDGDRDPDIQAQIQSCPDMGIGHHACLPGFDYIVKDLFDKYLAKRTPLPAPLDSADGPAGLASDDRAAGPASEEVAAVVQGVGSEVALIPAAGATQAHAVLVDAADAALFHVVVDANLVGLELVSPSGRRIDPATPLTDPAVGHATLLDEGPFSVTGYRVQTLEPGTWTLEVTGTGTPAPDTGYAVTALVELPPGSGVVLAAAVDSDQGVIGDPVTITATLTGDGLPVTDASVRAEVFDPDGDTPTEVVLVDDGTGGDAVAGDGVYSGVFTATTVTGDYDVVVSAEGPAFTREQQLDFAVVPSATTFSGSFSDRGVDADGDGRFDQLVIDVGVEADLEAVYRFYGTLSDGAGTAIQQLRVEQQLAPGPQTVALAFDGGLLFALGQDGPYLLEGLVLEDVATETGLAEGPTYTTAAYAHTDFQRPLVLLTGTTSDHGAHTLHMERPPFEELVVEVELDSAVAAEVSASARLFAEDGTFVAADTIPSFLEPALVLEPGLVMVAFHFLASQIFRAGKPGPYTLQQVTMSGTTADSTPVSFQAPGVVAVTQPYPLEDFAPSPRFTVGGTVTGLAGVGLELELAAEGPPGTPATTTLRRSANGPFTFSFPRLVSGNPYEVRVKTQPANPDQVCTITNASGTIEDANITNVEVQCV